MALVLQTNKDFWEIQILQ